MRSLVVTRLSPFPPNAGVPLRVAGNLAGLARLGPVDVIIIGDRPAGPIPAHIDTVETFEARPAGRLGALTARIGPRHPLAASLHTAEVEAAIERLGAGPGLVVLDEVWLAPYLPAARRTGRHVVYDSHNVETVLRPQIVAVGRAGPARRARRAMIAAQVRRLERRLVTGTDQVWVCSEADRSALVGLFGRAEHLRVVPNAVDTDSIRAEIAGARQDAGPPGPAPSVVFLGDLGYTPNEDGALFLLQDVLPLVRQRLPSVHPLLVGRRPTDRLVEAARAAGATVTGEVDSVMPYLAAGGVLAVTLRIGGGTRLKILEAMAAGLPIVTTSKGLEGIDAVDGEHLRIADEPEAIAEAIAEVLGDRQRAGQLTDRASTLVDRHYSWAAVAELIAGHVAELGAYPRA